MVEHKLSYRLTD